MGRLSTPLDDASMPAGRSRRLMVNNKEDTVMGEHWPEPNEKGLEWTARYPRPAEGGAHHPALLESRQREWDTAETRRKELVVTAQKIRDDREAKKQAERDAAAAREEERRQKQNAETEQMLRRRFLTAGGSEAEWQAEKQDIVAEYRRRQVTQGDVAEQQKRQAQAQLYRSF